MCHHYRLKNSIHKWGDPLYGNDVSDRGLMAEAVLRRRRGGGADGDGEGFRGAGDPHGEALLPPNLLLNYGIMLVDPSLIVGAWRREAALDMRAAAADIEVLEEEEEEDAGRNRAAYAFDAGPGIRRYRFDPADLRDIECLGILIFGPMFPTYVSLPL